MWWGGRCECPRPRGERGGSRDWEADWGGEVDDAGKVLRGDEEFDGANEIGFVDPGDELIARAVGATETVADEVEEDVEDAAASRG